jgi:hypothetical protein
MSAGNLVLAAAVLLVSLVFSLLAALVGLLLLATVMGLSELIGVGGRRFFHGADHDSTRKEGPME